MMVGFIILLLKLCAKKRVFDDPKGLHFALMKAIYSYNFKIKILVIQRVALKDF